jgi:hypothetical protein
MKAKLKLILLCFIISTNSWTQEKPANVTLRKLGDIFPAGTISPALPAAALQTNILICKVSNQTDSKYLWYKQPPVWLASVAKTHPIRELIPSSAEQCPSGSVNSGGLAKNKPVPQNYEGPVLAAPPPELEKLTASSLITSGLRFGSDIKNIYLGEFGKVNTDNKQPLFRVLMTQYLYQYGSSCDRYLPRNKVEITKQVCTREEYSVNRFGTQVGAASCIQWKTVGTGVYADPKLYNAYEGLTTGSLMEGFADALRILTQGDPLRNAMSMVDSANSMKQDMATLFTQNACASVGIKRYSENLIQFATGGRPIRLADPGGNSLVTGKPSLPSEAALRNQDYRQLLEDLVAADSKNWVMNKYVSESMSQIVPQNRDSNGRPTTVEGTYFFNRNSSGTVRVLFEDGIPRCLFFWDNSSSCRPPNRAVVESLEAGKYAR